MLIPGRYTVEYAEGADTSTAISVPGILEQDILLAIISWTASGGEPAAVAVASFTVTDGEIESASVSTANKRLCIIYLQAAES